MKALYFWSLFTEDLGQIEVSAEKNSLDIMQNISFCAPQNKEQNVMLVWNETRERNVLF